MYKRQLYGNAERAVVEIAHRLGRGEPVEKITDVRGTAFVRKSDDETSRDWFEIDSTEVDVAGVIEPKINPYLMSADLARGRGCLLYTSRCV